MNTERKSSTGISWEIIAEYKDGSTEVFPLSKEISYIGRSVENEITLNDKGISRKHLLLSVTEGRLYAKDLESKNGTIVNNIFIQQKELFDKDVIRIGSSVLTVEKIDKNRQNVVITQEEEPDSLFNNSGTIIQSLHDIIDTSVITGKKEDLLPETPAEEQKLKEEGLLTISRLQKVILMLNRISELVNKTFKLESLLENIMALLFDVFSSDRGFILLYDENAKKLKIKATKSKDNRFDNNIKISTTILNKVFNERVGIITSNAVLDPRFKAGDSIHMYGIRSVLCVPLWLEDQVIGVIYLDSLISENIFSKDDMSLLITIANNIALAVHKVRLMDNIIAERNIRNNLQRYFSPDIVEVIVSNIGKERNTLDLQKTTLSVLFCDVKDFSRLSEMLPPPQVAVFLNKYLNSMTKVIFDNGGIVDKFMGDGIMALFGAPHYDQFNPLKAVKCGIEMIREVERLNSDLPHDQRFSIRVGINTGKVVAGNLGSDIRMEYTALGDAVNVAKRLESVSRPQYVTIGEETYINTKNYFCARPLGELLLKGKTQKVLAYELTGETLTELPPMNTGPDSRPGNED